MPATWPVSHALGAHVGQHDRIEARPRPPFTVLTVGIGVGDVLELELVLLEQPTRPAFVDAFYPRLIKAHARAADRHAHPSARGRRTR